MKCILLYRYMCAEKSGFHFEWAFSDAVEAMKANLKRFIGVTLEHQCNSY